LSRQAVMVPSEAVKLIAATAVPLAAMNSAKSATTIAGVGMGILPKTPPKIAFIRPHHSFPGIPL